MNAKAPRVTSNRAEGEVPSVGKLSQHHAGVVGQAKGGAVDEANADPAVGRGLDDVAPADGIANLDFNNDSTGANKGARAGNRFNFADKRTGSDPRLRNEAGRTISLARRRAETSEHLPCPTL